MALIQNAEAIKIIRDECRLSISEGFPQVLGGTVLPIIDMSPAFHRVPVTFNSNPVTTGAVTIYTTVAGETFYITGISLSFVQNVTASTPTGQISITAVIDGTTVPLASVAVLTLTAMDASQYIQFANPIKVDVATAITLTGTFAAGAMSRSATIEGFRIYP